MKRKIIKINNDLCNGCSLCIDECHEGAIAIVDGKARLVRDDICDGLGDCLPVCPAGAIEFEEREAKQYSAEAVKENAPAKQTEDKLPCGCPGTNIKTMNRKHEGMEHNKTDIRTSPKSELSQWPVQMRLVPAGAAYFEDAHLLIAADCTAYAYGDFHRRFIKNKITLIGCPKLDEFGYSEKLTEILKTNNIKSVTVVRMEVPCCRGLEDAVIKALKESGKMIPWQVAVVSTGGDLIEI